MPETTDQPPTSDSTQLRPSRILAEPATVQACAEDYAGSATVARRTARARFVFAVILNDEEA